MRAPHGGARLAAFGAVALGLFLRLWNLGREAIWLDEAATWEQATRATWLQTFWGEPNHPPLWRLVVRLSIALFGDGAAALRLPSVLVGTLTIVLLWFLARRLARESPHAEWIATTAALLAATNGFLIEYSQEARMYAALGAESVALALAGLRWADRGARGVPWLYAAIAALTLWTHVLGVFVVAAAGMFVLGLLGGPARERRSRTAFVAANALAAASFVPWVVHMMSTPSGVSAHERFGLAQRLAYSLWRLGVGPGIAAIDRLRIDAGALAYLRAELPWLVVSSLAGVACLFLGARALATDGDRRSYVAWMIGIPIAGLLALNAAHPLMHEKYLVAVVPALLLVAASAPWGPRRRLGTATCAVWLGIQLVSVIAFQAPDSPLFRGLVVHGHPARKEDWRSVHAFVERSAPAQAPVLLVPAYLDAVWRYGHASGRTVVALADSASLVRRFAGNARDTLRAEGCVLVTAHANDAARHAALHALAEAAGRPAAELERAMRLYPARWGIWVIVVPGAGSATPSP